MLYVSYISKKKNNFKKQLIKGSHCGVTSSKWLITQRFQNCYILNNLDGNKGDVFWETLENSKSDSHDDGNGKVYEDFR